jgi:hypothetical protein
MFKLATPRRANVANQLGVVVIVFVFYNGTPEVGRRVVLPVLESRLRGCLVFRIRVFLNVCHRRNIGRSALPEADYFEDAFI